MSNDRHQDEQVSAAYRDLAAEHTPQHLDERILRMAKANAKSPRYSRWIAWSRPLAWATTAALCLAIALDFTQLTTPDGVVLEAEPEKVATPAAVAAPELRKEELEQVPGRERDQRADLADTLDGEKQSPARSVNSRAASEMRGNFSSPSAEIASSKTLAADVAVSECSEESRQTPESWLECIDALQAAGDTEAASRQRENLLDLFPEFKLP